MAHRRPSAQDGFTIVETMIVVGIVGVVATIALPSFAKVRRSARATAFAAELRVAAGAFEMYAMHNVDYPADAAPGVMPDGMREYLRRTAWSEGTPLGGQWDWERDTAEALAAIRAIGVSLSTAEWQALDQKIDDGDVDIGAFRASGTNGCLYIIEARND